MEGRSEAAYDSLTPEQMETICDMAHAWTVEQEGARQKANSDWRLYDSHAADILRNYDLHGLLAGC